MSYWFWQCLLDKILARFKSRNPPGLLLLLLPEAVWWPVFAVISVGCRIAMETHILMSVWGGFQKCLTEDGRPAHNVGNTILWAETEYKENHLPLSACLQEQCGWLPDTIKAVPSPPWWTVSSQTVSQTKSFLKMLLPEIWSTETRKVANTVSLFDVHEFAVCPFNNYFWYLTWR